MSTPEAATSDGSEFIAAALSDAYREDPYPFLHRFRRADGPVRIGDHMWITLRHVDALTVLRDPRCSSDERHGALYPEDFDRDAQIMMLFLDPPDHGRLRRLVTAAFTPRTVERLRPRIQAFVDDSLNHLAVAASGTDDGVVDLIEEFAYPIPVQVICELLGVPPQDEARFGGWSRALAASLDPGFVKSAEIVEAGEAATDQIRSYLTQLFEARRLSPGDDLITALLNVESEGDSLNPEELLLMVLLLLIAGHETTVNLIGNAVNALLRHRDTWVEVGSSAVLADGAIDELLRYDSPVQMTQRVPTTPLVLGDTTIAAGDHIIVLLGAANRDPAFVDDPDRLDLHRSAKGHVAFGGGIHHCLGMALAKLEGELALSGLARRFPDLQFAGPVEQRPTFTLRGPRRLPVRLR